VLLATREYGSGSKRIALLHGVSGNHRMFQDLIDRLTERDYTVIGVDLRGHGDSPHADSYEVSDFADDVVETLPAGLDVIAGHSLGGVVLIEAVERLRPERAIYLDPAWFVPVSFDEAAQHANVGEHPDGSPYSLEELAELNPGWGTDNLIRAQQSHARWDATMLTKLARLANQRNVTHITPPVPSLVVQAEESPLMPGFPQRELIERGYEVRVQPAVGHNLYLDDVDGTLAVLDGWL
jgi:pimeloyl-ACP methyl ester carboxylesterase